MIYHNLDLAKICSFTNFHAFSHSLVRSDADLFIVKVATDVDFLLDLSALPTRPLNLRALLDSGCYVAILDLPIAEAFVISYLASSILS